MNLHLLDPKFIMLAGVVILVIAVVAWLYVGKRRTTTADLRQSLGPSMNERFRSMGQNEKQKRN